MSAPHRNPHLGSVIAVTPSAFEAWDRCRRLWRNHHLLHVPELDRAADPLTGILVHRALEAVHRIGCCGDDDGTAHVLDTVAPDEAPHLRGYLRRHAEDCPGPGEWSEHEVQLARFHRFPTPMWMVTGKIDAVWAHGGVLDARDYKTGRCHLARVAEDPAAHVQLHLLAPLAARHGLRLRLTYEYLGPGHDPWPDPWEPEPEDLEALDERLAQEVRAMATETAFAGVAAPNICGYCAYRSVCPDTAG